MPESQDEPHWKGSARGERVYANWQPGPGVEFPVVASSRYGLDGRVGPGEVRVATSTLLVTKPGYAYPWAYLIGPDFLKTANEILCQLGLRRISAVVVFAVGGYFNTAPPTMWTLKPALQLLKPKFAPNTVVYCCLSTTVFRKEDAERLGTELGINVSYQPPGMLSDGVWVKYVNGVWTKITTTSLR